MKLYPGGNPIVFCFIISPGTCKDAKACRAGSHNLHKLNNPNTMCL